jgi:hypothetical protein
MSEPITLEPAVYWKLKAKFYELMTQEQQLVRMKNLVLEEAGLDTSKYYVMDDTTLTVRPQ